MFKTVFNLEFCNRIKVIKKSPLMIRYNFWWIKKIILISKSWKKCLGRAIFWGSVEYGETKNIFLALLNQFWYLHPCPLSIKNAQCWVQPVYLWLTLSPKLGMSESIILAFQNPFANTDICYILSIFRHKNTKSCITLLAFSDSVSPS